MVVLVVAGSVLARFWLLLERPLWFDELFTIWASRLSFPDLIRLLTSDSGPPLFYVLEKPLVLAGEHVFSSAVAARVLPFAATLALFAGSLSLPSAPARRRFLLLAAASPLLLLYSAEARAYALASLLGFLLFLLALAMPERRELSIAIALLSAAILYTHYLAIFVVAALGIVAVAERRTRSVLALLAGAVLFAFWAPIMAVQPRDAVAWMHEPPRNLVTGILSSFGGAGRIPAPFGPPLPPLLVALGAALALVSAVALAIWWRKDDSIRRACAFLVLFVGGVLAVSASSPIGFAGRTEMAVLPIWLWTIALAGERSRLLRAVAAAVVIVALLSSALLLSAPRAPTAPALALERLEAEARPGDVLIAGAHFYLPALLSAERGRLRITVHPFPLEQADHPGWAVAARPRPEDFAFVQRVLARAGPGERVFFQVPPSYEAALRRVVGRVGVTRRLAESPEMVLLVWSPRLSG